MRFGDILRELLEERELTQKQLAADLHLASSTLGNYIRNIREPDYHTLKSIADYFGVSTDYLLDHRQRTALTHAEDVILELFRALPDEQKELYLEQGRLLLRHCRRNEPSKSE